jgi:hypothetical protein
MPKPQIKRAACCGFHFINGNSRHYFILSMKSLIFGHLPISGDGDEGEDATADGDDGDEGADLGSD